MAVAAFYACRAVNGAKLRVHTDTPAPVIMAPKPLYKTVPAEQMVGQGAAHWLRTAGRRLTSIARRATHGDEDGFRRKAPLCLREQLGLARELLQLHTHVASPPEWV